MASIDSLNELLVAELRALYDAEQWLTKAISKLVEASAHDELADALNKDLVQTREHVVRLSRHSPN